MIIIINHATETPQGICRKEIPEKRNDWGRSFCLGRLYGAGFTGDNRPILLCSECGTLHVPNQPSISPVKD